MPYSQGRCELRTCQSSWRSSPGEPLEARRGRTARNSGGTGRKTIFCLASEPAAARHTAAAKALDEAARRFLSNPVIEDYRLEIVE